MDRPPPMEEGLPQDEDQKSSAPNPMRRGLGPSPQTPLQKGGGKVALVLDISGEMRIKIALRRLGGQAQREG